MEDLQRKSQHSLAKSQWTKCSCILRRCFSIIRLVLIYFSSKKEIDSLRSNYPASKNTSPPGHVFLEAGRLPWRWKAGNASFSRQPRPGSCSFGDVDKPGRHSALLPGSRNRLLQGEISYSFACEFIELQVSRGCTIGRGYLFTKIVSKAQ